MIQQIIDGVVAALRTAFPEVTRVYTEEVKQGFKEPCFVLCLLKPTNELFFGNRYYQTNLLSVQYFPKNAMEARAECYHVSDRLFRVLEYITVDGNLQRGTNMNGEYFDGTLNFFVNYNSFINVVPKLDLMEELAIEHKAK